MDRLIAFMKDHVPLVNKALDKHLPRPELKPRVLHEAMRYSALSEAKRMRPLLCLMSAHACGGTANAALPAACAVELIHTYSLIHDDLPSMDDDDMRRGRLTCHKAFDEATAILAGDALLTRAFEVLAAAYPPEQASAAVLSLAKAAGSTGLVGGQVLDMEGEKAKPTRKRVEAIHRRKTGALITAACDLGAVAAGGTDAQREALCAYGKALGFMYQIIDDLLDVESTSETLGKTAGKDAAQHKATIPAVMAVEDARALSKEKAAEAKNAVKDLGKEALMLRLLADYLVEREK